jgi:hypothetical protein
MVTDKNAFKNVIESLQGRNHLEDPRANWRIILQFVLKKKAGRDSSVGIATRYGLDGTGIESRWGGGEIFRTRPASYTISAVSFTGVKWPMHGVDHPNPSRAEVKERVELYLYSPSESSWPVIG